MRFFCIAAIAFLAGCYTYHPVDSVSALTGAGMRARLTPEGITHIGEQLGRADAVVDGSIVGADPDAIRVAVWIGDRTSRIGFQPVQDTIAIPRTHIAIFEEKRLSYWKTGAVVAGAGAALYLIVRGVSGSGGGSSGGDDPGGGPLFGRGVPVFRF